LCLKVYDGYRPQRSVNHFIRWAKDLNDTINKSEFYPNVAKRNLFKEEYIASRSGHSRGSTVDLTIIDGNTGKPLDMGSPYDFFGKQSWVDYDGITESQKKNRQLLQRVMLKHNFRNYPKEWWHFTLRWEPFPKTYFDFEVE
jgi:D-alanyl-D-alanine dipeptidase